VPQRSTKLCSFQGSDRVGIFPAPPHYRARKANVNSLLNNSAIPVFIDTCTTKNWVSAYPIPKAQNIRQSNNINTRRRLRRLTADRQRPHHLIRRNPIKPHVIHLHLHPLLHLPMQIPHLLQRQKTLKHTLLHPPPMPLQKSSKAIVCQSIRVDFS
jgi:hypothetical protein